MNKTPLSWIEIESLIDGYKRNLELMNTTQQIAVEATKSMIQLQTQYMKQAFDQLSAQARTNCDVTAHEKKATPSQMGITGVDQVVEQATKINTLLSKSNEKIISNIQKSFKEGFQKAEVAQKATKKTARKR
jgi:hypothetical protein